MLPEEQIRAAVLKYLTGEMPEHERVPFEERLIADEEFFDAVAVCEQEMIDSYAAGTLSREESAFFQTWIAASPRRAQRLRMAQSLLKARRGKTFTDLRLLVFGVAACFLVAVALSVIRHEWITHKLLAASSIASSTGHSVLSSGTAPLTANQPVATSTLLLVAERSRGKLPRASYKIRQDLPVHIEILLSEAASAGPYQLRINSYGRAQQITLQRRNLNVRHWAGQTFIDATFPSGSLPPSTYQADVSSGVNSMISLFTIIP